MRWAIVFLLLCCSCSPHSSAEFQREGEARCKSLLKDLQKIENREQLVRAESLLKKHFESLIDLMIEAREFQQKHPDDSLAEALLEEEEGVDASLEKELRRIYTIEGGREVIEKAQHEALVRLDAFERGVAKKKVQFIPTKNQKK